MNKYHQKDAYEILQSLLRQTRVDVGMRQVELADRLGVPQSFISKYESGERRLDILELRAICLALGISISEFSEMLEEKLREAL